MCNIIDMLFNGVKLYALHASVVSFTNKRSKPKMFKYKTTETRRTLRNTEFPLFTPLNILCGNVCYYWYVIQRGETLCPLCLCGE